MSSMKKKTRPAGAGHEPAPAAGDAPTLLGSREYSMTDQHEFASLSGDFNPVHVDPLSARRELFGEVVVHGMHGLLCALDAWLDRRQTDNSGPVALTRLVVSFPNPILTGQPVETLLVQDEDDRVSLQTRRGRRPVVEADVHFKAEAVTPTDLDTATLPAAAVPAAAEATPLDLTIDQIESQGGTLPLFADQEQLARAFPNLCHAQAASTSAELLALTRLVGMHCPGLHSIFSSLDVEIHAPNNAPAELSWKVELVDKRFSLVRLHIEGPTLSGSLVTFRRPEPQRQADIAEVRQRVDENEFSGQVALVVGGTRGLGEVTSRIIAAGGGRAVVTYYRGLQEAQDLAAEICGAGLACDTIPCDVAVPEAAVAELRAKNLEPTHLYYFASPKIFVSKSESWEPDLFQSFMASYVTHFQATVNALRGAFDGPLTIFYPSSSALDDRIQALAEYSAAKAAGEELCRYLDRFEKDLRVEVRRLPRIATDQTLTLTTFPAASALDVMLEVIRDLSGDRGSPG
jgi:acyl dehydratase/NAD(P)-dependent dehydrogenase (short-subunit alcohol dehydrogenase family)